MKTFVYGDSFSNHKWCNCSQDQMWYAPLVQGELVDRTREGASTQEMFLLAVNDAVQTESSRFIMGTGQMYSRIMLYRDQLYADETVQGGTVTDCLQHFDTQRLDKDLHPGIFHHTLVWSQYLSQVATTASLLRTLNHNFLIAHMNADRQSHVNLRHPLVRPLLRHTAKIKEYVDHRNSCKSVCEQAGIQPHDYHQYSWSGHHGAKGQKHFGQHIYTITQERELWN